MIKIINIILYYISLILGLIGTSWIIWARFLRQRVIRDIPDPLFTEYRFWILLYICMIYLYTIKQYIKPKDANLFFAKIFDLFFLPLITLDHFIKYNRKAKSYYYTYVKNIVDYLDACTIDNICLIVIYFQIVPRSILILFLLIDTFWFNRLEIFYKVIFIGLLPFLFRYFNYSLKDISDHWLKILEEKYLSVFIYEKGYESLMSRRRETKAKYHYQEVSVKDYIEIKFNNMKENLVKDDFPYEYVGSPLAKDDTIKNYAKTKYQGCTKKLNMEDYKEMDQLFLELMPEILKIKLFLEALEVINTTYTIKFMKISIFSLYFLCWSFILIVSYWCYPVEFTMFKYFFDNAGEYLILMGEPFALLEQHSFNENLITIKNIKRLLENIWENLLSRWKE